MEEKRRFVRIQWPIVVQYKTLDEPYTSDQIVGKDISESGVCFIVYERLVKGTRLDMQIQTPFDSLPIFAKGKIAWIRKIGEEHAKTFEAGIELSEVDPKDKKRLKLYVDNEIKLKRTRTQPE